MNYYCDDTSLYYTQCQKLNISPFKLLEKLEFSKPLAVFLSMESRISTRLTLRSFFDRFLDPNKFWNLRLIWSNSTSKLVSIGLASLHSGVAIYVRHVPWDSLSWFPGFVFLSQRRFWKGKWKKSIRTSWALLNSKWDWKKIAVIQFLSFNRSILTHFKEQPLIFDILFYEANISKSKEYRFLQGDCHFLYVSHCQQLGTRLLILGSIEFPQE